MQTTQNNYNYGKKFRKYTYSSIPISFCILALLTVGYGMVNPFLHSKTYAMEDNGVDTPTSRAVNPNVSLTVNNETGTNTTVSTTAGSTAYISNDIRVQASDIESYALQISYANGSSSLNGNTAIGGAGGKTGSNLSDNTWGYGWANSSNTIIPNIANTDMVYNTLPAYGSGVSLTGPSVSNNTVDFAGKLVFGAKFGEDASSGHYRTKVLLSLVATPKAIPVVTGFAGIKTMQAMTTNICKSAANGTTGQLYDTRDYSTYTIRKHEDGNCWMTQNLRIVDTVINSSDSDMTSGSFTIPSSSISGFGPSDQYKPKAYYANDSNNGAYYNWYAATAGSGDSSLTSGDASNSICPKGWKLPPNSGNGSYTLLASAAGITSSAAGSEKISSAPYSFPYAGSVGYSALGNVGSIGDYWSRTANTSNQQNAHILFFGQTNVNPTANYNRYIGYSVRCVATDGMDKYVYSIKYQLKNGHTIWSGKLPDNKTIVSTNTSQTFTTGQPFMIKMSESSWCPVKNWLGSDGNVYNISSEVTLTKDKPNLTLTTHQTGSICGAA